jgi:hypothetical protein
MKKLICFIFILSSICFYDQLSAQDLKSELLYELEAELNPPQAVGPVLTGTRIIFPAKSGFIKGEKLNGKILPGGGDWGLVVDSTTFKLDVRVTIETDDGALIYITYGGYVHTDAKKFAKILEGKWNELTPSDYYFRTNPVFETSSPKYAWLNHTVAVGVGRFLASNKVAYRVFAIK